MLCTGHPNEDASNDRSPVVAVVAVWCCNVGAPPEAASHSVALLTTTGSRCILLIMLEVPRRDRIAERREATRAEILQVAWELAQEQGLAEFTLRDLAERVGMRAPSLYTHFASKHAIYDAMFGQAWSDFEGVALAEFTELPKAPRAAVRRGARVFFDFAVANPARHQLMNQRTIPGFEPSPESYAPAVRVLQLGQQLYRDLGVSDPADLDIYTAIIDGMINQQLANDPGGTRWSALLDRAVDIWADGVGLPPDPPTQNRRATQPRRPRRRRTSATKTS
jgi:AcrR family transcriptional regulator